MASEHSAGHTPGPWAIHGPGKVIPGFSDGGDYAVLDHEGEIIAEAIYQIGPQSFRPAEANARLIAAAPELLDGCAALLGLVRLLAANPDMPPALLRILTESHRIAEAEAAIAKATGAA